MKEFLRKHHDPERERRALEAWRRRHSLVSRLVDAWASNPERALRLAAHVERWYGEQTPAGERWPYQWLMADVAHWPRIQEPKPEARVRVLERRWAQRQCPVCQGTGSVIAFVDLDGVRRKPHEELMEEGGSDPFAQDQVVRQALQRLGLPVNLIGPLLRRVVRYLPLGAIVETAETGDWWVLSRWGVSWTSTPIHPMAFVRAGYPPRIAELLYKGQEISEEAVKAERPLMVAGRGPGGGRGDRHRRGAGSGLPGHPGWPPSPRGGGGGLPGGGASGWPSGGMVMDLQQVIGRLTNLMSEVGSGDRAALIQAVQVLQLLAEGRCAEAASLATGTRMPAALATYARRVARAIEGRGYAVRLQPLGYGRGVLAIAEDPWTEEALANAEGQNPAEALVGLARILGVQV
ncbi:hypothetical protein [Thermus sp. 93170]|uniref:hypothetical protein n=1 Tax=Thermus sp. 93170 TaxID=1046939 RepID=UPI003F438A21